jgi:predicted transcriptional regulator
MQALNYMLEQYETLKTLSLIAEGSPKPTQYLCTPRELILRSNADWDKINRDLQTLESEALVQISKAQTPLFSITLKGIEKMLSLEGKPINRRRI